MKLITVIGARPQFVKAATVSRAIKMNNEQQSSIIEEKIVHTGQHYDANLSDIFFEEMEIPKPSYSLGVGGGSHGAMTGRQLEKIEEILLEEEPDGVLVYGDTNSTLAGALAAAKLHIPVIHVEAGLRSFNMLMPEEINRILTDNVSSFLLCPTESAIRNLNNEGFANRDVFIKNVGDVMFDAAMFYQEKAKKPLNLNIGEQKFILCTIHRAENTDSQEKMVEIIEGLNHISRKIHIVIPVHPRTRKLLAQYALQLNTQNITMIDPVGYYEMLWLIKHCSMVITDSGGLQKEAYFFKKRCLTIRDQTEWVELINVGANTLVATNREEIRSKFDIIFEEKIMDVFSGNLYGDGKTASKIIDILKTV
jgi:UDP-GlcNAc3NAcA epimerase